MRKLLFVGAVTISFAHLRDMLGARHNIASTDTAAGKDRTHASVAFIT